MAELCLIASHGYPPGLLYHQEQGMTRVIKVNLKGLKVFLSWFSKYVVMDLVFNECNME